MFHPWLKTVLTKAAAPHGNFTGVSFGKYFINGQQVSKEAYAASKQGQQATTATNSKPTKKPKKVSIQQAASMLAKQGYTLGKPTHDLKSGVTSYAVRTPGGQNVTMTAQQVGGLLNSKGKRSKPAATSSGQPTASPAGRTPPPTASPTTADPRHNPDLDAAFGEPTQTAKPDAGPIRGANPDLDAFMNVGEGINAKQPPKPQPTAADKQTATQLLSKIGRIQASPDAIIAHLKQQLPKLTPQAQQAFAEAAGLWETDSPEEALAKIRKAGGTNLREDRTPRGAPPPVPTAQKPWATGTHVRGGIVVPPKRPVGKAWHPWLKERAEV